MGWVRRFVASSVLIASVLGLAACGNLVPVKSWEKGVLARPEMGFEFDRMDAAFVEHTYTSKEAASGGTSAAGGGCGCN